MQAHSGRYYRRYRYGNQRHRDGPEQGAAGSATDWIFGGGTACDFTAGWNFGPSGASTPCPVTTPYAVTASGAKTARIVILGRGRLDVKTGTQLNIDSSCVHVSAPFTEVDKSRGHRHDVWDEIRANPHSSRVGPSADHGGNPAMPSPFPGMNPYLEQEDVWHDFHERFIPLAATLLGGQLRPRYIVKIDEHIYVHDLAAESRRWVGRADVSLGRGSPEATHEPAPGPATGLLEAPAQVRLPAVDRERLSYVEIRDRRDRELVTVIELLSPANKYMGPDRGQYLAKRVELLNGPVHLVEIDLLAVALPCQQPTGPIAPIPSWSAGPRPAPTPSSGRSRSDSACP